MNVGVQGFSPSPKCLNYNLSKIQYSSSVPSQSEWETERKYFSASIFGQGKIVSEIPPNSISISFRFYDSAILKTTQSESKIFFN